MLQFINYRMRITLDDRRTFVGRFMAFDKHMNLVLSDCEEFRRAKKTVCCLAIYTSHFSCIQYILIHPCSHNLTKLTQEKEQRRALGLVLLRGECVVSVAVESLPASASGSGSMANKGGTKRNAAMAGLGDRPPAHAGRGINPAMLSGSAPGLSGAATAATTIQPQMSVDPRLYPNPSPYGRGAGRGGVPGPSFQHPHGPPPPQAHHLPPHPGHPPPHVMPPAHYGAHPPQQPAPPYGAMGRGGGRGSNDGSNRGE